MTGPLRRVHFICASQGGAAPVSGTATVWAVEVRTGRCQVRLVADAGIEQRIQHIDDEIDEDVEHREEQD